MRLTVFIQTNDQQLLGAKVAAYALKKQSKSPDAFDIEIMRAQDFEALQEYHGQTYLREGATNIWNANDLQSFTLTRFLPPQLMQYQGRAIVIDPDVFACADIMELFNRDMKGRAILAKPIQSRNGLSRCYASSVMLLDCEKLRHWQWEENLKDLFSMRRDYRHWMSLLLEEPETIGQLEEEWNHYDTLTPSTKLLHNTQRITQPWKTGLPANFALGKKVPLKSKIKSWVKESLNWNQDTAPRKFLRHPDPAQEKLFFDLLRECLETGEISNALVLDQVSLGYIRPDSLSLVS